MKFFRTKPISLAVQLLHLQRRFVGSGEIRRSRLMWTQTIQPHPLAHVYRCRLEHTLGEYPQMYCLDPLLSVLAAGRKLPHVRTRTEPIEMCLFMRRVECWTDDMFLANVTVPLASYWLAHFEEWLFSGHWRGGGTHEIDFVAPASLPVFPSDAVGTVPGNRSSDPAVAA